MTTPRRPLPTAPAAAGGLPAPAAPGPLRSAAGLLGWLALCFAAGGLGALASADSAPFYMALQRPAWAPPAWLFGPVWSVLYAAMAVAAWQVWRRCGGWRGPAAPALALFVVQLAANALWTWLFFAARQGGLAFAEIVVLALLVAATAWRFRALGQRAAALLLLPYLAWVLFAAALNLTLWRLNPAAL